MQKRCLAAFYHLIIQTDKEAQHYYCPNGITSWCSYKRDQVTTGNEGLGKDRNRLDPVFLPLLSKMIEDLTSKELLSRCLRGLTQNSNESLNSVLWSILSKSKYHGFSSILGVAAVASVSFNGGRTAFLEFLQQSSIAINEDLYINLSARDEKRIVKAQRASSQREQTIMQKYKQRLQQMQASQDVSEYAAGAF